MDKLDSGYKIFTIIQFIFLGLLFCVGSFIQVQIISVSYKERDTAWKMTITHSIVTIIYFAFEISFDAVTHFIPFLSQYTGNWICYAASFVTGYCYYCIGAYTLLISNLKYILIVQRIKTLKWGKETIKKWFFLANLFHPFILSSLHNLTSDWDYSSIRYSSINSCLRPTEDTLREYNISSYNTKHTERIQYWHCPLKNSEEDSSWYAYYVTEWSVCNLVAVIRVVIATNILEGFYYYKIFEYMRR